MKIIHHLPKIYPFYFANKEKVYNFAFDLRT